MYNIKSIDDYLNVFGDWLSWYIERTYDELISDLNEYRENFFKMLAWVEYSKNTNPKLNDFLELCDRQYQLERSLKQCDAIQLMKCKDSHLMSL